MLAQAASRGDIKQLDRCIRDNVDISLKDRQGRTALHIAVTHRHSEFVKHLLHLSPHCIGKGADLDLQGLNALHICVKNGDIDIYRLLLKAGFDSNITTKDGKTIHDIANEYHHKHLIEMWNRTDVTDTPVSSWTELHHCAVRGSAEECSILIEHLHSDVDTEIDSTFNPYSDLDLPKHRNVTPLELAMYSGNVSVLEVIAKYSSFTSIEKCLADSPSTEIHNILVRGILDQLLCKHKDVQYGKLIATGENVIVLYTDNDQNQGECFRTAGIRTMYRSTKGFDKDNERAIDFELDMEEPGLSRDENALMQYVVRANSDSLWNCHKNLNGIRISAVRTRGGKALREDCIVLCCKFKGFLSGDEDEFPRILKCAGICFPVDVREDHTVSLANNPSDMLEPLACGGRISGSCKANRVYGTIGPFVQLPDQETGFITCAHIIDNNPRFGVVQDHNHLIYQPERSTDYLCGEVVKMAFKPSSYPSMDAAIVKVTAESRIPRSINFVASGNAAFFKAGLGEGLTFNTGAIGTCLPHTQVLKFGAFSSVLVCKCSATGHEESITYPEGKVLMKGLSKILCRVHHQHGDSGAGVFVQGDNGDLACVGIFFAGRGREGFFIPIRDVLRECGNCELKRIQQ
ncbi:uncharacterized protein LOC117315330 [Pecten maximus]|uniref:uncharacterized protein LOC117315330 n=1 Tax=Pecten maximus TaxID=6579 RepID=UPI001457ED80|nr:uncharacterized protein LOC117315330 [Pecten maximus]